MASIFAPLMRSTFTSSECPFLAAVIKAVSSFYREEGEKDRDNYIETQVLGTLTIVLDTRQFIKQTVIPHHKLKV